MAAIAQGFDVGQFAAPVIVQRFAHERGREAYAAVADGARAHRDRGGVTGVMGVTSVAGVIAL